MLTKERNDLKLLLQTIRDVIGDRYFESKGVHRQIINSWVGLLMGMIDHHDKRIADITLDLDMVEMAIEEWHKQAHIEVLQ